MEKTLPTLLIAIAAACLCVLAPPPVRADSIDEPLELDRGANPDTLAKDTYQAALQAADRRFKMRMARCDGMEPGDRAECRRIARDLHDTDVARASDVLSQPR